MFEKHNNISIDSDDDDNNDYKSFDEYLQEVTVRNRDRTAIDIELMGVGMLSEIENKKMIHEEEKEKLIKFILKRSKVKYVYSVLKSYSYEDVKEIYNEIRNNRKSFFKKLFEFLDIV